MLRPDIALVFAATAAATFTAAGANQSLEDVQIGENGRTLRVALICSARCEIEPAGGATFRILGVDATLDVDLSGRSALASRLTVAPAAEASILAIESAMHIDAARVIDCRSDSGPAPCIEFRFGGDGDDTHPDAAQGAPALRDGDAEASAPTETIPFIGAVILAPQPSLREPPLVDLKFAPPERLSPPAADDVDGVPSNVEIRRPSLIAVDRATALGKSDAFDFRTEAAEILGKAFDVGTCEGAKARLIADAWALDAMIDAAYCKAGKGDLEAADADFARLLAYTPDNYEALVGRGLIALASGDRARGHDLLQDALNALPPIAESDRIVAAMERN